MKLSGALVVGCLFLGACDDGDAQAPDDDGSSSDTSDEPMSAGERLYREPIEGGNTFACASCHALTEPAADGLRRAGHAIGDATRRPSYKNGQLDGLVDAVNSCLVEWMNADPWTEDDPRYGALFEFLDGEAPAGPAPALSFAIAPVPADLSGGVPEAGRALFNESCVVCHGTDGIGTERGPGVAGLGLDPGYVATRVRTSGRSNSAVYPGLTGGIMPFWAADRLTDEELRNLVAWLEDSEAPEPEPDDSDDGEPDPTGDPSGTCDATHPLVGATAELVRYFHDVGGTAEVVDDCTIVIRDFTYDGTGIDVRIYGGLAGNYDDGFAMSDDLLKPGGYAGETLTLTLPEGYTLDDLDGVSVWCVDVGIDFGSGMFE